MSCKDNCCCSCECDCNGSCDCSCCGGGGNGGFKRRFQTRKEQTAELEAYLAELKLEVQAVEEKLADLKRRK